MPTRRRVLVAGDEPDTLLLCRGNLEFLGYEVIEAPDGETVVQAVRETRPDVVLLAVTIPGIDGWAVLEAIKEDPESARTPVVILAARVGDEDQHRAWSKGAAELVTTPFSPMLLMHVLEDVLATTWEEEERRRRVILQRVLRRAES